MPKIYWGHKKVERKGNPYHGIFVLDEQICEANQEELIQIRERVWRNRKYSLDTKKMIQFWILERGYELKGNSEDFFRQVMRL